METMLLREQEIYPSKEVLKSTLGKAYSAFEELEARLAQNDFDITFDWHYYKDSKGWLCKVSHKKKTVFWLSVWNGFFKTSFFFLERHLEGIAALEMDKNSYTIEKTWGKMLPFLFTINSKKQFPDLLKLIQYKKGAK
ncbi:MAG: DUF3788 domain-containing protein [Prevotellaceae bacterium]|jgi:hypothetical protein|nr:DUF3788 domain-containing protein [Prevotellaceae bacterium]